ncbi:MAG: hypothetical protein DI623_12360, partial [Sphingomonas sanxanigenens]
GGDAGVIGQASVQSALDTANSEIDAAIAARHKLPLVSVPEFLRTMALNIARHALYRSTPPDGVQKNYDSAQLKLSQIASGRRRLDQGVETEASRPGAVLVTDPGRIFSRQTLDGF